MGTVNVAVTVFVTGSTRRIVVVAFPAQNWLPSQVRLRVPLRPAIWKVSTSAPAGVILEMSVLVEASHRATQKLVPSKPTAAWPGFPVAAVTSRVNWTARSAFALPENPKHIAAAQIVERKNLINLPRSLTVATVCADLNKKKKR